MIQAICYAFIYLFEVLACFWFLENFYNRKVKFHICCIGFAIIFGILYGISFLGTPLYNLIAFILCYFIITIICYESKLKSQLFTTLILAVFMLLTEMVVVHVSSAIIGSDYTLYLDNFLVLIIQSSLSKLFFFVLLFFLAKVFNLKNNKSKTNKFTVLLGILPLVSAVILHSLSFLGIKTTLLSPYNKVLALSSILLLFANLFVFYIYELVQKTNYENTQLQLEIQRSEISTEYYELLSKEYENSRILIHDIKNHFQHIAGLTMEGQPQEVIGYIDSISKDFGLKERIKYSGNDLVDVIINRYAAYCKENGLIFEVEALCSKLEFMDRSDVSSLLDNLLTNAVEAAEKSENKRILLSIYRQENSFVMTDHIFVKVVNSCDSKPKIKNGLLMTSKINSLYHGFGTKSVRRVVSKYNGDYNWEYNKKDREFMTTVILQT